jgi:hypothetical protein
LTKLIELFKVVEESGNQAQLHLMFNIFKNLGRPPFLAQQV